jgi:hypothetical protein
MVNLRVSSVLYPRSALLVAAERLSEVCTVGLQDCGDAWTDVAIDVTSPSASSHVIDEYFSIALAAMIEQRSTA